MDTEVRLHRFAEHRIIIANSDKAHRHIEEYRAIRDKVFAHTLIS